jgi:hypothetical protein
LDIGLGFPSELTNGKNSRFGPTYKSLLGNPSNQQDLEAEQQTFDSDEKFQTPTQNAQQIYFWTRKIRSVSPNLAIM